MVSMEQTVRFLLGAIGVLALSVAPSLVLGQSTTLTTNVTVTGNAHVVSTLSKGSGSFVIDHPLDPRNKLLYHSFVESPDVKNLYDGIAVLDAKGEAVIELPSYFMALNKDFRYLATPLGEPAPNLHLKRDVRKSFLGISGSPVFVIAGGTLGQKVSWQVTGIRHDPLIKANPIVVEVEKGPNALVPKGEYLIPEVYE